MIGIALFVVLSIGFAVRALYGPRLTTRAIAYALLVISFALFYWSATGLPRHEYGTLPHGKLIAYYLEEPRALYLWVLPQGATQPVYVRVPWDRHTIEQLLAAAGGARPGQEVRIGKARIGERRNGGNPFYLSTVNPTPPKNATPSKTL